VNPIIRQIIDRDCHVGESYFQVICHVVSKLKNKWNTFRDLSAKMRGEFVKDCIQAHKENRELYYKVMSGKF